MFFATQFMGVRYKTKDEWDQSKNKLYSNFTLPPLCLNRINEKTGLQVSRETHCEIVDVDLEFKNKCSLVVCTFKSKRFRNW